MEWTPIAHRAVVLSMLVSVLLFVGACVEPIPSGSCGDGVCQTGEDARICSVDCDAGGSDGVFEAESFSIGSGFSVIHNASYSNGSALTAISTSGSASRTIGTPNGSSFALEARVYGPFLSEDAVYVYVDGVEHRIFPSTIGVFEWVEVSGSVSGDVAVDIVPAETGAVIDALRFVMDENASDPVTQPGVDFSLRGDPTFDVSRLSPEQRKWYDRTWAAVNNVDRYPTDSSFENADAYFTGRTGNMHHSSLLLGLRSTGDLRFLDEIDRTLEMIRGQLRYRWCENPNPEVKYGSEDPDGYRGFLWMRDAPDGLYYCRDYHRLEDALIHGHIAQMAYTYEINRDLESPSGVDYGARADFWLDYLRNDFEAKWRERRGEEPWPEFPFFERHFVHTYSSVAQYHYYVGKTLEARGDPDAVYYLDEAERMAEEMFTAPYTDQAGGFQETGTEYGTAIIAPFGTVENSGTTSLQAAPTTYYRYAVNRYVDFHLEGFDRFTDPAVMEKMATGVSVFIYDTDPPTGDYPFARDIVGGRDDQPIPHTTYRGRVWSGKIALCHTHDLIPWDSTGRMEPITMYVYDDLYSVDQPWATNIPSAMLFTSVYEAR